jgi:hypothetical protein
MTKPTKRTPKREEAFLAALEETANVKRSCEIIGLPRRTVYEWRDVDADFAKRWERSLERGTDALEDEAIRRAHEGMDKPVYQGGVLVGYVREYSDTLMIFMLKARRPHKFRDNPPVDPNAAAVRVVIEGGLPSEPNAPD